MPVTWIQNNMNEYNIHLCPFSSKMSIQVQLPAKRNTIKAHKTFPKSAISIQRVHHCLNTKEHNTN